MPVISKGTSSGEKALCCLKMKNIIHFLDRINKATISNDLMNYKQNSTITS